MARIGLTLPRTEDVPRREIVDIVQQAETLGYESVWVGESWGRDGFTWLTQLACHTHTIKLATGITPVYSRSPALIAQTVASLDEISEGRVILGLGTSGPIVIENWHGVPFERPLRRTREYIEIIRLVLSGERVNYKGEIFQLKGFRLPFAPPRSSVPIYVASLGPQNLRLTGELADGWLPIYLDVGHLPRFQQELALGAQKAGRGLSAIDVAPYILACVSADVEGARALVKAHLAYYIGGMGTFYANLIAQYGFEDAVQRVREAWGKGDRRAAAGHVSDEMVSHMAICGSPQEGREQLARYRAAGVTLPIVSFAHGACRDMIQQTLESLAG
ncbi:MAG TPA: LLM class flavin-dependent oxidoreductase [Alphaproteobacteria bacterium]|nr:LLM class flavin-dependent oxidoreductase [Alphaproteobacteria bacterium]